LSPPAVTALARTESPNSTAATKLFPYLPYRFLVPLLAWGTIDANDPHCAVVKGTGMLGAESLKRWTMSSVSRWKRLMSPQGVFQVPKSCASLSDAATSDSSRSSGVAFLAMYSHPGRSSSPWFCGTRRQRSSAQKTARAVGTDSADQW